jgi:hypothetical protein
MFLKCTCYIGAKTPKHVHDQHGNLSMATCKSFTNLAKAGLRIRMRESRTTSSSLHATLKLMCTHVRPPQLSWRLLAKHAVRAARLMQPQVPQPAARIRFKENQSLCCCPPPLPLPCPAQQRGAQRLTHHQRCATAAPCSTSRRPGPQHRASAGTARPPGVVADAACDHLRCQTSVM